jgi:chromosome partitioning protein
MITVALAGSGHGSGKTMLAYHLAYMLAHMGFGVLAVDLDPQPDLTAGFLDTEQIEALWGTPGGTVWDGVRHVGKAGGAKPVSPVRVHDGLALLPGDPALGEFEDSDGGQGTPFRDIITAAGRTISADIALVDLGPGMGTINRSALAAADKVMVVVTADAFSLRGLSSFGPRLRALDQDQSRTEQIGYVITTQGSVDSIAERAFLERLALIPATYAIHVAGQREADAADQSFEIGRLRDYRSLEPLARSARKPMFDLSPGDGAVGATANFVRKCHQDFAELTRAFASRVDIPAS